MTIGLAPCIIVLYVVLPNVLVPVCVAVPKSFTLAADWLLIKLANVVNWILFQLFPPGRENKNSSLPFKPVLYKKEDISKEINSSELTDIGRAPVIVKFEIISFFKFK